MDLAYRAFDKSGREVTDTIAAASAAEATDQLRARGLYVAGISPVGGKSAPGRKRSRFIGGRNRRLKDLAMFTRQLHVLIQSGTPWAQALGALARQTSSLPLRHAIMDIQKALEGGASLSEAMAAHPEYFDLIYCGMIAAGEASGNLPVMLDRLAALARKQWQLRSNILGSLAYPFLLVFVASAVFTALLLFVIPRFAELFSTLDAPLPPSTQALIGLSDVLRSHWWALLIVLGVAAFAGRFYVKTSSGRRTLDTVALRLPRIGRIVRSFLTARVLRLLGVLVQSHLTVLEALRLARGATTNIHYTELLNRAEAAVSQGQALSSAFADTDLVTPAVYEVTCSGEASGKVGPLLLDLADFLDEENEISLRILTSLIEPAVLILMGLLVGFVAISMFLPLFDLTGMIGGGAS